MAFKIVLTPNTKHWAKLVEKDTEKFVQWLSNPYEQSWSDKCKELLKKIYEMHGNNEQIESFVDFLIKMVHYQKNNIIICKKNTEFRI